MPHPPKTYAITIINNDGVVAQLAHEQVWFKKGVASRDDGPFSVTCFSEVGEPYSICEWHSTARNETRLVDMAPFGEPMRVTFSPPLDSIGAPTHG